MLELVQVIVKPPLLPDQIAPAALDPDACPPDTATATSAVAISVFIGPPDACGEDVPEALFHADGQAVDAGCGIDATGWFGPK